MRKGNENEFDEAGIESALGNLPRVEAPINFDGQVRSRIAEGRGASAWQPGWVLGLKFALPTIALLLLGAYLFIPGEAGPNNVAVAPVNGQIETPTDKGVLPDPPGPIVDNPTAKDQLAARMVNGQPPANANLQVGRLRPADPPGGGSRDLGQGQEPESIYPEGLNPNQKIDPRNVAPAPGRGIPAETILSMLGVKVDCGGNGCVAAAVGKQSVADKAGVKPSDVIEAIDDKPVKAGTVFEGAVSVNSLRVVRGGKRITLSVNAR